MGEWLGPGKLSEKIATSLVTHPVDRAVNNVRTLDRSDSGLITPIEL